MQFLYSDEIKTRFRRRGWVWSSGSLYYNGNNTTAHPHLHILIDGQNTVRAPDASADADDYRRAAGDIRGAVTMIAYSDGMQGQGGGGITYMRLRTPLAAGPRPDGAVPPPAAQTRPRYSGPSLRHLDRTPEIATNYAARATRVTDSRILEELEWLMAYFLPEQAPPVQPSSVPASGPGAP